MSKWQATLFFLLFLKKTCKIIWKRIINCIFANENWKQKGWKTTSWQSIGHWRRMDETRWKDNYSKTKTKVYGINCLTWHKEKKVFTFTWCIPKFAKSKNTHHNKSECLHRKVWASWLYVYGRLAMPRNSNRKSLAPFFLLCRKQEWLWIIKHSWFF